jgi:Xaa-Pro aminopeptidase
MLAQDRRRRLLEAMRHAGIDTLVIFGTSWQEAYLRYVADFGILEGTGLAVLTSEDECTLYVESVIEAERATIEAHATRIVQARNVAEAAGGQLAKVANQKLAAGPAHLLPGWLTDPQRPFKLADAASIIDGLLLEKMPSEIAAIRKAAALADDGYRAFREAAKPGRKQYEVVAEIEGYLRSRGSPDNFMIIGSGGADVKGMTPPSERRLAAGDLVTTELTPAVDGYFAQICRTLVLGPANAVQKKAFAVYLEALEAGIAAVRPGVTAADVARAENDVFRHYGLGDYVTQKYTRVRGHGVGLMPDQKPPLLEDVATVLTPGMTMIVHPNTYHPEAGYLVLGDVVVVTQTGCEVLTRTPRCLFEVPA